MKQGSVFEQRDCVCQNCGCVIHERYVPFIDRWIKDKCECIKKAEQEEELRREKTRKEFEIIENKRLSGIEPRYRSASFENYITTPENEKAHKNAMVYAKKFSSLEKKGTGLIFTGNTGSGKTHLACALANKLLDEGVKVRFITFSDLMQSINGARDYGATENALIKELQRCRLLIIDDIGTQAAAEKSKSVLFAILDKRINNFRPTIFTSNVTSLDEIKNRFNEQIYDRIKGNCYKIEILCSSHRKL